MGYLLLWRLFIWLSFWCDQIAGFFEARSTMAKAEALARFGDVLTDLKTELSRSDS